MRFCAGAWGSGPGAIARTCASSVKEGVDVEVGHVVLPFRGMPLRVPSELHLIEERRLLDDFRVGERVRAVGAGPRLRGRVWKREGDDEAHLPDDAVADGGVGAKVEP